MLPKTQGRESGQSSLSLFGAIRRGLSSPETWTWLFVAVGLIFRVTEFSENRGLYMDEGSLFRNLGLPVFDFSTTLSEYQLAPPGFLVVERAMVRLPFNKVQAARFIPLLCGLASMFVMRSLGRRYLLAAAVPITVALFALDDWLIYYSTELKQYSSDILLTQVALLIVPAPEDTTRRRQLVLAAFGVVGLWFSHPLALVLGAIGSYLAGRAAIRRDWTSARGHVVMSLLWAVSFAVCYSVSHRILSKESFIWDWWHFAFLPIPPRSLDDLVRTFWQLLNIFNSPARILTPLGIVPSAFIALAIYLVGARSLGRRWPGGLYLLIGPVLITLLASVLHQYPFHGRLLLFLVPTIHMLVGEGTAALGRPGGPVLTAALAACLLVQPTREAIWNQFIVHRSHGAYDSHGDLFPDLLDYLERPRLDNPTTRPLR